MSERTTEPLLIGMSDIAMLAKVQRPVVSMWRSRAAPTDQPFPPSVVTEGGQERFDAAEVAQWLVGTGRGNNPAATNDVAAFATVAGASPRDGREVFAAVTALLCLKVIAGRRLNELDRDDLLDLADAHDPDDEFLYAELESVGDRLEALARYADLLADAAFSPMAAFEKLMADRFRSGLREHTSAAVSEPALSLAAKIAVGLADRDGIPPVYVDPTPGSSDLLLAVIGEHGDRSPLEVMTALAKGSSVRLVRRRLRIHDVYRENLDVDDRGTFDVGRPVTHVAQFPTPAAPRMSDAQMLSAIENIVVQMDDSQRGVVIAPASALSDGFADRSAEAIRADILRAGHVRAIVRLPKGLVPARSRQALALWVLGPSHHGIGAAERFTMVADLANTSLTSDAVDSLVTDLVASTGSRELVRAHAFRFVRSVPTRTLLVAKRSLAETASGPGASAREDASTLLLRIEQSRTALDQPHPSELSWTVVAGPPESRRPLPATVGTMLDGRGLQLFSGNRLDEADLGTGEGVRVIGVPELIGQAPIGVRTVDRLVLAGRYDAARFTEPGDVVFCASPRPAAVVDRDGSSVVAYPARVLRIDAAAPSGLLPDVLAADINATPVGAREWRLWPIRRVADDQRSAVSHALAELRRAREESVRRLEQLDLLTDLLTHGMTSGALSVKSNDDPAKGH